MAALELHLKQCFYNDELYNIYNEVNADKIYSNPLIQEL